MGSLFSSRSGKAGHKIDLDRARSSSVAIAPLATRSYNIDTMTRAARKDLWCVCRIISDGGDVREAVILNVSKSGARLRFRSRVCLPSMVRIKAGRIGLNRMAKVVWQNTYDAGVKFVPSKAD